MAEPSIFSLEVLHDAVAARFVADAIPCEFQFGWREVDRQGNYQPANIVMVPGDESGSLGEVMGARFPGGEPVRSLAGLWELFTVTISAFDGSAPENERAQYRATRKLYDHWLRAVYLSAFGNWKITKQQWITARKERRFGAALRITGGILAVVPDLPVTLAPADTHALITESLNTTVDDVVEILPES
jgi:hypothetical protein